MADAALQPAAETPRKRRDLTTPLLLTLSVHLMAFTLLVNHRLFSLLSAPPPGIAVLNVAGILGEDPRQKPEDDPGAAAGPKAEVTTQRVADLLREEKPVLPTEPVIPAPLEPTEVRLAPTENRSLADRLKAATDAASSSAPSETARPGSFVSSGSHGLRGRGKHGVGLNNNGGSSETENAVELGLRWLASVQDADGRWDADGFMVHYLNNPTPPERFAEGTGYSNLDLGLTALSLLAFTGAGYTDRGDAHRHTVANARAFLLARQRAEDGGFGEQTGSRPTMYDHAIATLAICDLYLTTGDIKLLNPIQHAVRYMLALQQPEGGWTYEQSLPKDGGKFKLPARNDLSISGWCIMALSAAREAGVAVPAENLRRCVSFLKLFTRQDGEARYADVSPRAGDRGLAMMAVSNLCRRLLGEPAATATQHAQLKRLSERGPEWARAGEISESMYMWYYGSVSMLLAKNESGGEARWRNWNVSLKRALVENQCAEGPRRGSFDPVCFWAKNGGGRVYSTAIAVLNLEIYYRYDPQFLRTSGDDLAHLWK